MLLFIFNWNFCPKCLVKFRFSEKATKFEKNFPLVLMLLCKNSYFVKTSGRFFQILWPSHNVFTLLITYCVLISLLLQVYERRLWMHYIHGQRTPGEEIAFTAWPKINSQYQILSATSAQIFGFLWFMPSLGVRSPWLHTLSTSSSTSRSLEVTEKQFFGSSKYVHIAKSHSNFPSPNWHEGGHLEGVPKISRLG